MIEASAAVTIDASPGTVWSYLEEFETLWEESNPDHDGTNVLSQIHTEYLDVAGK